MDPAARSLGFLWPTALVVLGLAVFGRLLGASFAGPDLGLDDDVRRLFSEIYGGNGVSRLFLPLASSDAYAPVRSLSWFADHAVTRALGGQAFFPPLQGILLHGFAAILLAGFLRGCQLSRLGSAAGAALFLAHPVFVEAIARVEQRGVLLVSLGAIGCAGALRRAAAGGGGGAHLAATLWALFALGAHPAAAIVVVAVAGLVPLAVPAAQRGWRGSLVISALGVAAIVGHAVWGGAAAEVGGAAARLGRAATVVAWPGSVHAAPVAGNANVGFAGFGLMIVLLVVAQRRVGGASAGLFALGIASLAPVALAWTADLTGDPGAALAIPWVAAALAIGLARGPALLGPALIGTAALACAVFSFARCGDYRDSQTLWTRTLQRNPDDPFASVRLAALVRDRDPVLATDLLRRADKRTEDPHLRVEIAAGLRDLARRDGRREEAVLRADAACAAAALLPSGPVGDRARVDSWLALASLRFDEGNPDAARAALERARAVDPADPAVLAHEALLALAQARDERGRVAADAPASQRARGLLDGVFARDPEHYDGLLVRARWEFARGNWLSAVHHFQRARRAQPLRPESYLGEADVFLMSENYPRAEQALREGIGAGIGDPNLLMRLGLVLAGQGQLDAARVYYERYLDIRPLDRDVRRALAAVVAARAMTKINQVSADELEADAARIRDLDPAQPKADVIGGLAARLRRQFAQALVLFERAFAALPEDADLRRFLAETLRDRGYELLRAGDRRATALEHFRRFVDVAPPSVPTEAALTLLGEECRRVQGAGIAAMQAGDLEGAEKEFRRCLFLRPDLHAAQLHLGMVLLQRGGREQLEAALGAFAAAEAGQRRGERDASLPVLYRVMTLRKLGRDDEARAVGRAFLDAPNLAEPSVLERIERAIGDG